MPPAPIRGTYTVQDTPDIVARIEADLRHVLDTVRAGDPGLHALVLTGGFARGEGAVRAGRPQNDYDFVAVRGVRPSRRPYPDLARQLERDLGLHIDLAPVPAWRLRFVAPSIFWYETARRGRVLHRSSLSGARAEGAGRVGQVPSDDGARLLSRIPVQMAQDIDPREGLRLIANRAAGLLLATATDDPDAHRLQAAKALLAALDANLLAAQLYGPSQTERMRFAGPVLRHAPLRRVADWVEWAYSYKVAPDDAPARDPKQAWQAARKAILGSVPVALAHAGIATLDDAMRGDGVADHLVFARRAGQVPAPWTMNPTARVRVATLRLLESTPDGRMRPDDARRWFGRLAGKAAPDPVQLLDRLRHATLQ